MRRLHKKNDPQYATEKHPSSPVQLQQLVPLSVGAFYLWFPAPLFWAVQALLLLCTISVSILDSYLGRRHARQAAEAAAKE